jgi:hypothetical protein
MTIEIEAGASHDQCSTKPSDLTHCFSSQVIARNVVPMGGTNGPANSQRNK